MVGKVGGKVYRDILMRSEFRNMTLSAQVETLVLVAVTMALCEYWTWRKVIAHWNLG